MKKPSKHYIAWKKWQDPLTTLKNQVDHHNRIQHLGPLDWDDDTPEPASTSMHAMPMLSTPMGLMPASMPDLSAFDFWMGHTNFHITLPIWKIINTVAGVESLDVYSPYRFRISVGQAFNASTVKINVSKALKKYLQAYDKAKNSFTEK